MLVKLKKLLKDSLWRGSVIVLIGNILASFFSYLYHLISGRLLSPQQYGLLESLIALTYFSGVFSQSFSFAVINILSRRRQSLILSTVNLLEKKAIWLSIYLWLLTMLFFPILKTLLHLPSFFIYFLFSLQALIAFLPTVYLSSLQARLKFMAFSGLSIIQTAIKVVFAWFFILLGWQAGGAYGGFLMQGIIGIILGISIVNHYWSNRIQKNEPTIKEELNIGSFFSLSFVCNLALTSLFSTDILLVRHYFNLYQAGIYSAGSVLAKIIFFVANAILLVAFPLFSKHQLSLTKLRKVFITAFGYVLVICFGGIITYKFFPQIIVKLLYGEAYKETGNFLSLLAIFTSLLAIFGLVVQFFLALKKKQAVFLASIASVGQIFLIILRHGNLQQIIINSILSVLIALLIGGFLIYKELYGKKTYANK